MYNEKCDIWSLGVIIFKMIFGEYPFMTSGSARDLMDVILKTTSIKFPKNVQVSQKCIDLIKLMLVNDPV